MTTTGGSPRHGGQMYHGQFGTLDALIGGYVAGSLPRPLHVLVDSHLEMSPANRGIVAGLETAAGLALDDLPPAPMDHRDVTLAAIFAAQSASIIPDPAKPDPAKPDPVKPDPVKPDPVRRWGTMPRALRDFVGCSIGDIPWKTKMPGFREYDMDDVDGCHVSMFWIKPGRTVPAHTHEGMELSMVITGAFNDQRGRFGPGDISIADPSVDHRPTAEDAEPCIGFAVTDAPLRLTGSLRQRLSDILAI